MEASLLVNALLNMSPHFLGN